MRLGMLRGRGLAPEDCRSKGMLEVGRENASEWLQDWADTGSEGSRGLSSILPEGVSQGCRVPPPAATPRPRRSPGLGTHLASSSSGVSGHFAVKWAVTALDAVAVLAPSRVSHSATERRSSLSPFVALACTMARRGKREKPRYGLLHPVLRRPLPVGGAAVRYSAGCGCAHAWPARSRAAVWGAPG